MNVYCDLFLTFARAGVCTFGGGYAMLPILQRELVENRGWATEDELADYYAIGQCTPGVIAVNTATFVGSGQAGIPGGIVATLGLVFPSLAIILAVAAFLSGFMEQETVTHAFHGIRAGVVALILTSVLKLVKKSATDRPTRGIYALTLLLACAGTFLPIPPDSVLNFLLSPACLVAAAGAAGLCIRAAGRWKPL